MRVAAGALFLTGVVAAVSAVTPGTAVASGDWGAATSVDPSPLSAASCPTTTFCVGADASGGVVTYDGTSWSSPDQVDPDTHPNYFNDVSCATSTFCVAIDYDGHAVVYNGTSWSTPYQFDTDAFNQGNNGPNSVSCPTASFCAVVDSAGNAFTYNGSSWTSYSHADGSNYLNWVSCASASFCVAVDANGNALTWNGSGWSSSDIDGTEGLSTVSCPTTSFCVVGTQASNDDAAVLVYDGSWSSPEDLGFFGRITAVSCTSSAFCMAATGQGQVATYIDTSAPPAEWSPAQSIDNNEIDTMSCAAANFCGAVDSNGDFLLYNGPEISQVRVTGSVSDPTITVLGNDLQSAPAATSPGCSGTGEDYLYNELYLEDGWYAGQGPGDCIGLLVSTYSSDEIVFTLGDYYTNVELPSNGLNPGDQFVMGVYGVIFSGNIVYSTTPDVTGVTFYGSSSDPFVVVTGDGFGTEPSPEPAGCSASGDNYSSGIVLDDTTEGWDAGSSGNCIGLFVSLYTDTEIAFSLGSDYEIEYCNQADTKCLDTNDTFILAVDGESFSGTVSYSTEPGVSTTYSCSLTSSTGTPSSMPVTAQVFDTSTPPSTMDVGASYSTSYGLIADLPEAFIQSSGANEIVVDGASLAVTTSGGGSMTTTTNTSQTTNTPVDLNLGTAGAADTLIGGTFGTVSWTAASAGISPPGTVDFLPSTLDLALNEITGSVDVPATYSCSPSPVNTIDSTTVAALSSTSSYQASAVPLGTQVTAGKDAGWSLTVSNTSSQEVTGVTADISASDGGPALSFDLATMADDGADCTSTGPGEISCQIGDLDAGTAVILQPLVETTGLADGTTISGSADLTPSDETTTPSVALGNIDVAVIANSLQAVASPGIPVTNTTAPLSSTVPVKVVVTLYKKKKHHHHASLVDPQQGNQCTEAQGCAATVASYVTVTPGATTAQPLCPSTGCLGEATVELSASQTSSEPITAAVSIYFSAKPSTSDKMWALEQDSTTPFQLASCPKTVVGPCIHGKLAKTTAGSGYQLTGTVYFLAGDPAIGIR